ncbi:MAG TPA: PAS domain-containing protein, partial [Polyangiales bacterium]|nr:PAS domain-containing protein [Polyangiales bacterium]
MREVSCRAFERLESAARVHGLSLDELVAGLPVTLAELRNPDEWMDWDVHAELCARFERATGPEASVQMGRAIWSLPYGTSLRRVASLAIDLKHLIRIGLQWRLPKVHRNIGVQIADAGRHELEVELTIPAHLRGSPEWLRVMQGALEGAPLARGLPPAQVRAVIDSHRGVYHIALPAQRTDPLALLRTLFGDPALAELDRQVEELRLLEAERARMDAQLRDRERTLSNLITNLSGIVYRCRDDERWTLDFASAGCLALTGYPADELISTHDGLASLVHADDLPALRSRREQARLERASCSEEYRIQTRSGEARWVL